MGMQGAAYPYHWGALRPAMSTSFLALIYSSLLRSQQESYAARLFNYAQYQVGSIYVARKRNGDPVRTHATGRPDTASLKIKSLNNDKRTRIIDDVSFAPIRVLQLHVTAAVLAWAFHQVSYSSFPA